MDYMIYLQAVWDYLPLIFYSFVFITLLPKSWGNIHQFAEADAAVNARKFHRCYGPDVCCHTLEGSVLPKQKPRKAVTRVYPKRQSNADLTTSVAVSKRIISPPNQLQKTLSQTNVNQIAKMFEAGTTTNSSRKVNRVTPILTEIQTMVPATPESPITPTSKALSKKIIENPLHSNKVGLSTTTITKENIENSVNLLNLSRSAEPEKIEEDFHRRTKSNPPLSSLSFAATQSVSPVSSPLPSSSPVSIKASLEDIFAAFSRSSESTGSLKCNSSSNLSPVTSIEEILAQRRLSRPLSAYSISDLLCDSPMPDEAYIENFFRNLNKT